MSDRDDYLEDNTWEGFEIPDLPGDEIVLAGDEATVGQQDIVAFEDDFTPVRRTTSNSRLAIGDAHGGPSLGSNGQAVYTSYAGTDIVAQVIVPGEGPLTLGEMETFSYSTHREKAPIRMLGRVASQGFVSGPRTVAGTMIFLMFNSYVFYRLQQFAETFNKGVFPIGDMLPPFDMILTFSNEQGVLSKMRLMAVTITDEGGTMSVDDMASEQTFNYMARGIQPITGYFL